MEDKQTTNIEQGLKPIKEGTNRGIACEISKKTKQKSELRFLGNDMRVRAEAYVRGPATSVRIIRPARTCKMHAC